MTTDERGTLAKGGIAVQLHRVGGSRWRIEGDLGLAQVAALAKQAPPAADEGRVVLDLGGVRRTSSAAVALLLEWRARLRGRGEDLILVDAPATLCRLAMLYNVDRLLGLADASQPAPAQA